MATYSTLCCMVVFVSTLDYVMPSKNKVNKLQGQRPGNNHIAKNKSYNYCFTWRHWLYMGRGSNIDLRILVRIKMFPKHHITR